MDAQISKEAYEIAAKQKKLGYQIKRNKASYLMLAPYFILFFLLDRKSVV